MINHPKLLLMQLWVRNADGQKYDLRNLSVEHRILE